MLASIISMKWEFEHKGETFDILAIYQKHLKQLHFRWHHCYEGSLSINLELYQRCGTYVHKVTIPCISLISLQRRRKHVCTCFCLFHFCCKPRIMNHWLAPIDHPCERSFSKPMQFANVQLQCCASWSRRHQFPAVKWLLANKASALYNARDYCLLKLWKTVRKGKCSAVVERQRQVPFIVVWKWAPGVQPYKIVGAASSVWLLQCYKPTAVLCRCVSAYVLVFCFSQCVQWCSASDLC